MKKYQQLLLFVISVISLSLLLVYRHEYNRLHYVLEVFDFFGQPCNFSDLQASYTILDHLDWGASPLWQENENIYMYSAFWNKKQEAKAIVLQLDGQVTKNCYLWFENHRKPFIGKFKYSKISHDPKTSQSAYFYYCSLTGVKHTPYAVSFTKGKKSGDLKKVLLTASRKLRSLNATVCVAPSDFSKTHFMEFLSYHKLIGIDNFIFYSDIPHRMNKIISNLSHRLSINVTFFPWNFPKQEGSLSRTIVENDCLLRTLDLSKSVITLEQDEYIVPSQHYSYGDFVSSYESKFSQRLSLPVQLFCIKNTNRRKPLALQNTEVNYNGENTVRYIYQNNQEKGNVVNTQAIIKGIASIHKYINCIQQPTRVYHDKTILKYSTDFIRSTLVQLSLHDQI